MLIELSLQIMRNGIIILSVSKFHNMHPSDLRDVAVQTYLNVLCSKISKIRITGHTLGENKNMEVLCDIKEEGKLALDHAKWTHMLHWK